MRKIQKWFMGIVSFLIILFAGLYFFDWNVLRPYIASKVTEKTGRRFAINGDLKVHLSLHPRVIANNVVLGNADWSKELNMAEVERLNFKFDLLQLFVGNVHLPEVILSNPHLVLEVNKLGKPNWLFTKNSSDASNAFPEISSLTIDQGNAIYRDPRVKTDLTFNINTIPSTNTNTNSSQKDAETMLELMGKGLFKGMPSTVNARGGALLQLRNADHPYSMSMRAVLGTTKLSAQGVMIDPLHLKGLNLQFILEGSDLALLYPLVGVPIPPTPAYKIAADLSRTGDVWTLQKIKGIVGRSDLNGDFSVDVGQTPQFIKADLVSNNLDLADLGGFIGGKRGDQAADKPPPLDKLLPTEPFNLEKLRAANADVKLQGLKIITQSMPLEKMQAHILIKDGTLKLVPLNFSIAGGNLEMQINVDGRQDRIATHADILAKGLHLDQLMPTEKLSEVTSGAMGGRAKLDMSGNSVAQMLGSANGKAALIMEGGNVSELALRLSNLDIANSLARLIVGDKQTPIRCMVSNLDAVNGDFKIQDMLLDTPKMNLHGTGNVNLKTEEINVRLKAESKSFSLASLRGPINISGTLKNPELNPEMSKVIIRSGFAVALGSVTGGIGALIPLLEFGEKQQSHCAQLIAETKEEVGVKASDLQSRKPTKSIKPAKANK